MSDEGLNQSFTESNDRIEEPDTTLLNADDTIDDEIALHHAEGGILRQKRDSKKKPDGGFELSTRTKRRTKNLLKAPPSLQRTKKEHVSGNRVGGFDPVSLAWLQRMEELATIWLNMLVQKQHLFNQYQDTLSTEKQRIVDFCSRTLQQILSEGGFRSYTTPLYSPSSYSQPLPPLQDLPCMVVTLKHWYITLLSRCQHQTAVTMLPHRVLAPQQLSQISIKEYVHACETEVKQWLRSFVEAGTKSNKTSCTDGARSDENQAHVAVWMQQLQKKSIPKYSPVKPKSTSNSTTQVATSPCQKVVGSRLPSPTDVMMFDSGVAPTLTSDDCDKDEFEDLKPAAKNHSTPSISNESFAPSPCEQQNQTQSTNVSLEKANHMRGLILSLYHANKCPFPDSTNVDDGRCCPVSTGCRTVKDLWHHITSDPDRCCCIQNTCTFGRLALVAEEALTHFGHCKKASCFICGPVLAQMPKVKRDIAAAVAVETSQRQAAAAVEQAILQVVDDITADVDHRPVEANDECDRMEDSKPITTFSSSGVMKNNEL